MIIKSFLFFILFVGNLLQAHQTGLSYVDVQEDEKKNVSVVYKKPLEDTQAQDIYIKFPQKCMQVSQNIQTIVDGFVINKYKLWCTQEGLMHSRIWVEGLVSSDRGVLIRYESGSSVEKSLLRSTTPFMYIDKKSSSFELLIEYTKLGIVHIWGGFDHLLFVLALVLLSLSRKTLLYAITAFTLSHSITLAFGILGIVAVEIVYVEAMIALSIVFLAKELMIHNRVTFTREHLGVVAFIFGLLHGFGFSSVLASIGLPQDEIPLSLFSFNLGIEIGQLLFIACVSLLLLLTEKYVSRYEKVMKVSVAYFIGTLSSFWLIERVISF